jgi:hypothetical protein
MLVEQYTFGETLMHQQPLVELQLLLVLVGNKVGLT